jgi:hypothetical protein
MHSIATEIAKEIRVFFENRDLHASPRQQITQHHTGWASTDDTASRVMGLLCHRKTLPRRQ